MTELFSDGTKPQPAERPEADPEVNYLEELVGDDKKFKSTADLARGKYESDQYIERLQQEMKGLREDLNKRSTMEELVDQLKSPDLYGNSEQVGSGTPTSTETPSSPNSDGSVTLSQAELQSLIEDHVNSKLGEQQKVANIQHVEGVVKEKLGEGYQEKLTQRARDLDLSEQFLIDLAAEKPQAFLNLMVPENVSHAPAPETSGHGSVDVPASSLSGNIPAGGVRKNFAYYEKIRREDGRKYWSTAIQQEMWREAKSQGEAFYT